jgi:hypothetical protein
MEAPGVPEVDPGCGGELDLLDRLPPTPAVDELGFVQPVDGLGQGVVIRVAAASDRTHRLRLGQPLGVAEREVLDTLVGAMDEVGQRVTRAQIAISNASTASSALSTLTGSVGGSGERPGVSPIVTA